MQKIQIAIGVLLIVGLSLGIGFGFYHEYDGKNVRTLAMRNTKIRDELKVALRVAEEAQRELKVALRVAEEAQIDLAHYMEYIFGKLEAP